MNARLFIAGLTAIMAVLILLPWCTAAARQPNIIFFIADDMYPDMFNCLPEGKGKNLTPNIDRLAREGTIMTQQYVVSPVCTPSRYNCLTGMYASRARNKAFLDKTKKEGGQTVIQWNTFITQTDRALPHRLQTLGYKTGLAGKNHVIEAKGLYRFPDFQADPQEPAIKARVEQNYQKVKQAVLNCGFDYAGGIYHNNPNFIGLSKLAVQNLDWVTQAGVKFIDQYHDQPFFLYFATTVPHQPAEPMRSWKADPKVTARGYLESAPRVMPARDTLPRRIKGAGLKGKNKELILWLDDALGALINRLEQHDLMDDTIIFFFNDHGQKAKGTLYQGGTLNPSIVWKQGGFTCGPVCDTKISNVDFAPTILDYAGLKNTNNKFDGRSFKPVLEGKRAESRESLYFELGYARAVIKGKYKYYAVRYPDYARNMTPQQRARVLESYNRGRRFRNMPIVNEDPKKPFSHLEVIPGGGQAEHETYGKKPGYFDADQLYNLETDPFEIKNLARDAQHQDILATLKAELKKYIDDLPGTFDL